jgi:hypothetical protein
MSAVVGREWSASRPGYWGGGGGVGTRWVCFVLIPRLIMDDKEK